MLWGVYLFWLCFIFFNVSSKLLLLDLCVFFCVVIFKVGNKKYLSFLEY